MNNEQILKKAIDKIGLPIDGYYGKDYYSVIFSHDFAKAFWGEEDVMYMQIVGFDPKHRWKAFEYHLMRMILEKEPLKYIEKFL